jgi:ornithine cyclodeaminase
MSRARPLRRVRIWSPDVEHAERLARSTATEFPGIDVGAVGSVAEAVSAANIVCTTTAAIEPVLPGELLEAGMHVNAVGSSVPFARELDGPAMGRATVFTDRRESLLNESGDFLMAREEGFVADEDVAAEVGEVLIGEHPGRRSDDEITLFESLGVAVEDVAAGAVVLRNARAAGAGTSIHIGGMRRA